jgi:hypothetical protein
LYDGTEKDSLKIMQDIGNLPTLLGHFDITNESKLKIHLISPNDLN